jgi:hypothetical protein
MQPLLQKKRQPEHAKKKEDRAGTTDQGLIHRNGKSILSGTIKQGK